MEKDSKIAYAEIDEILKLMEKEYYDRIPERVRNFFSEERDKDYKATIDVNIPLEEQKLQRKTKVLLGILDYNYWCDSEEEKKEILKQWEDNEKKVQEELREKYNPDNLFKKKSEIEEENVFDKIKINENLQMVEYKGQNFIKKLLHKISKFFKKN